MSHITKPMTPEQMLAALWAEGLVVRQYPGWERRCRCCPDSGPHNPNGPFIRSWGAVEGGVQHITGGGLGDRTVEEYIRDIILNDPTLLTKCQFVTDPDGVVWVVAAGRANHAGGVGTSVKAHMKDESFSLIDDYDDRFRGTSADGNAISYGNEAIAASAMNAKQRASSVLLWAAIGKFHEWSGQNIAGHGEISQARTKADPNLNMGQFRRDIMARIAGNVEPPVPPVPPKPPTAVWGSPSTWKIGSVGPDVTKLGQRLVIWAKALGLPAPYQVGPGPEFTETDRSAVAAFQRAQGWSGADADGYPGPETFKRLAADPAKPPAPSHETITVLTLNVASRNAAVNKKYGAWSKRVAKVAAFMIASKADHVTCQELYAENRPALDKLLAGKYANMGVRGGRVLYKRVGSTGAPFGAVVTGDLHAGSGTKYVVGRRFVYPSGAVLNLSNAHLSYETGGTGPANRVKETNAWIAWQRKNFPAGYDFYVGDVNSPFKSTTRRDVVEPVFNAKSLHDMGRDVNATAGPGKYHLDRGFGGLVKCKSLKVTSNNFTDHPATQFTLLVPTK